MRYENSLATFDVNPDIVNIVGRSLGGSVALELQNKLWTQEFNVNTYGAPVFSFDGKANNRYRNQYDPVSILDSGAQTTFNPTLNPHTYDNFNQNKVSNNSFSSFVYRIDS